MPNHVTNTVSFGTDEKARAAFQDMLRFVKTDDGALGSMDFNKLIPMPEALNIACGSETDKGLKLYADFVYVYVSLKSADDPDIGHIPEDREAAFLKVRSDIDPATFQLGKQAFLNIRNYGAPTWYEWCNKNWGTKWNAYDCAPAGPAANTLTFHTAWGGVPKLMRLLSKKFPAARMQYRWADEDIGVNVGEIVYKNGRIVESNIPESGSREAFELAADIRGVDLKEYGLSLSKDGSTYRYEDEPEPIDPPKRKSKGHER